jgi:hypothetical protein
MLKDAPDAQTHSLLQRQDFDMGDSGSKIS